MIIWVPPILTRASEAAVCEHGGRTHSGVGFGLFEDGGQCAGVVEVFFKALGGGDHSALRTDDKRDLIPNCRSSGSAVCAPR